MAVTSRRGAFLLVALAAAGSWALWLAPSQHSFVATGKRFALSATAGAADCESAVALYSQLHGKRWKGAGPGATTFPRYEGYSYKRKATHNPRIRLAKFGGKHDQFYRILVQHQPTSVMRSDRYIEEVGWWDPWKDLWKPDSLHLKADRCVYWLRYGANPTDQVASFLDMAGIIRRTGPGAKRGEWEWRIPQDSGPEAPEGWSSAFGAPQVTWGNKPDLHQVHQKCKSLPLQQVKKLPLVERYGFRGYTRIPIEEDLLKDPLTKSTLTKAFPNTDLPVYE